MAPFLPFVQSPEQLEGKRAEPGQVGRGIQPLEQAAGPLGPILVAPIAAPVATPATPFMSAIKRFMPGGGGGQQNGIVQNGTSGGGMMGGLGSMMGGGGGGGMMGGGGGESMQAMRQGEGFERGRKATAAGIAAAGLVKLLGPQQAQRVMAALSPKLPPGKPIPMQTLYTVQGGKIQIGAPTGRWQLIVVYRGKHDPVSRNYLVALGQVLGDLQELGVELLAVSGDPRERAESFVELLRAASQTKEVPFKIAYGLTLTGMRQWGLYISEPRNDRETDRPFPEPAMFLLNEDGLLHMSDYSNSPFCHPDIRILIEGIRYIQENDYPVRGDYDVRDGIDWPRVFAATMSSDSMAQQQQQLQQSQ